MEPREYGKTVKYKDGERKERWLEIQCEDCGSPFHRRKQQQRIAKYKSKCNECAKKMKGRKDTDGNLIPQTDVKKAIQSSWVAMIARTTRMEEESYPRYGGRGIKVEFESFGHFYEWAINNGHKIGLYIERRDNDKNYSEENCKWATPLEQAQNRTIGKTNKTGLAGVVRRKDRYTSSVKYDGVNYGCGTFDTPEEAHQAYLNKKAELTKETL